MFILFSYTTYCVWKYHNTTLQEFSSFSFYFNTQDRKGGEFCWKLWNKVLFSDIEPVVSPAFLYPFDRSLTERTPWWRRRPLRGRTRMTTYRIDCGTTRLRPSWWKPCRGSSTTRRSGPLYHKKITLFLHPNHQKERERREGKMFCVWRVLKKFEK